MLYLQHYTFSNQLDEVKILINDFNSDQNH